MGFCFRSSLFGFRCCMEEQHLDEGWVFDRILFSGMSEGVCWSVRGDGATRGSIRLQKEDVVALVGWEGKGVKDEGRDRQ